MSTPISSLRNLGPAVEAACKRANIHSAEELRELGADAAYAKLLHAGERPHFIGYYAIAMALQGRPWSDCQGAEKQALRSKFDQIKATHAAPVRDAFERALNEIGVRPPAKG